MSPSHLSTLFLLSLTGSTFLLQWDRRDSYPFPLWAALGTILCLALLAMLWGRLRAVSLCLTATLCGLCLALLSISRATQTMNPAMLAAHTGQKVRVEGVIVDAPDRRPGVHRYVLESESMRIGTGASVPVTGKTLVVDKRGWPQFQYGDRLQVSGLLERPRSDAEFSYENYLEMSGIRSLLTSSWIEPKSSNEGWRVFGALYALRERTEQRINTLFPEPHASLLAGLLLGSRRGMPEDLALDFQETGLTHIVAISGYNIALVITLISGMLFWLPLKWRYIPAVIAIILFTLLVGASASVVRAAIMGILSLTALELGRRSDARLAILWTLGCMIVSNPLRLWWDAGFQLSFLAVIGLVELTPIVERWTARLTDFLGIRDSLTTHLATQLTSTPWIAGLFGRISLISPLANFMVAPAVPIAMLTGTIAVLATLLWPPLGQVLAFPCWLCLEWIIRLTELLGSVPFASIGMTLGSVFVMLYYMALIVLVTRMQRLTNGTDRPTPSLARSVPA